MCISLCVSLCLSVIVYLFVGCMCISDVFLCLPVFLLVSAVSQFFNFFFCSKPQVGHMKFLVRLRDIVRLQMNIQGPLLYYRHEQDLIEIKPPTALHRHIEIWGVGSGVPKSLISIDVFL